MRNLACSCSYRIAASAVVLLLATATLAAVSGITVPSTASAVEEPAPGERPAQMAAARFMAAGVADDGLRMVVNERGRISQSTAAAASSTADGVNLQVNKPASATVRAAYLAYATVGNSGVALTEPLQLEGHPVPLTREVATGIQSYNYFSDVTDIVKPVVDRAGSGAVNLHVVEPDPENTEGEILVVIYDDPSVTVDQTVSLLYGAQSSTGDTYNVRLAAPVDVADPASRLEMSLGISFSYQSIGVQQYSSVDVNGQRLTTAAGGEDDGHSANGGLITAGGEGDSIANPDDPQATPVEPRSDDELYDLRPLVETGDRQIAVTTNNPSRDDNVFLATFTMNPPVTEIDTGQGPTATPDFQERPIGGTATIEVTPPACADASCELSPPAWEVDVVQGPNYGRNYTWTCSPCLGTTNTIAFTGAPDSPAGDDLLLLWPDLDGDQVQDPDEPGVTATVRWNEAVHAVAMGDAYSAGEGLDPFDSGTDDDYGDDRNQCHRSPFAYALHSQPVGYDGPLADSIGGPTDTQLDLIACAGATASNVMAAGTSQYDEGATQLDQGHVGDDTDLITLTIGGNDVGFSTAVTVCALEDCDDPSVQVDGIQVKEWTQHKLDELPAKLDRVLPPLRDQAAGATVVLLGYPRLFPTTPDAQGCSALANIWENHDQDWFNSTAERLDTIMATAAARAGVHYVSTLESFAGHAVCGQQGAWLIRPTAEDVNDTFHDPIMGTGSFHPTAQGQASGYSAPLSDYLRSARLIHGANPAGLPHNPEPTASSGPATSSAAEPAGDLGDLQVLPEETGTRSTCLPEGLVRQGSTVRLAGEGFAPNSAVDFAWDAKDTSTPPIPLGGVTANGRGAVAATVATPKQALDTYGLVTASGDGVNGSSLELVKLVGVARSCPHEAYSFAGFFAPVDNTPTINTVEAGRAIPMKFSLDGDQGLDILAEENPTVIRTDCTSGAVLDEIEQTVPAGSSSLSYSPANARYTYVWKTEPAWAGSCRTFTLTLNDGSTHTARFSFR